MEPPINQAVWLDKAGTLLELRNAPMPVPGIGEIVIKNAAVAMNGVDNWMLKAGVFIQKWPAIIGNDIAGTVYQVGTNVQRFKIGDRVVGHGMVLVTGLPEHGAFQLYTLIEADRAAILPEHLSFTQGVILPLAIGASTSALFSQKHGQVMPGVSTPLLGLPYPSFDRSLASSERLLVIYGGSSTVGLTTTQLATASGITVLTIAGSHNFSISQQCGATQVFDHKDPLVVEKTAEAVLKSGLDFIGILDTIAIPETYETNLRILDKVGGGHLICSHPPPKQAPISVKVSMIYAVNDAEIPLFNNYVTGALQTGKLKCLPEPIVVGRGLKYIQDALKKLESGVSAGKVVVEL